MTIAKGISKLVAYKKESSFGALAGSSGAQRLRRVTSALNLTRDSFSSNQIATHQQISDFNLGTHRATLDHNDELSLVTYQDFFAAGLRKAWTAGVSATQADFTSVTTTAHTIVAASGSFLTKGFKVGDVVRLTGFPDAANNAKNIRISGLTASTLTTPDTLVANAVADTSFTIAVVGSKLWVPVTGHTNDSFNIEHYYSDVGTVEVGLGMKVSSLEFGLPATGNATLRMQMMGQTVNSDPNGDASAPYFTSPTAETTTPVLTAVRGIVRVGSADVAIATSMTLTINENMSGDPVIGSNYIPELFPGRVGVTGQFTAYYKDGSFRSDFANETEISIHVMLSEAGTDPVNFMSIYIPRLKITGDNKDDGEKGLIQTIPFQALLKSDGGSGTAYDQTTISFQDSRIT